jgi:predicted ATPase
MLAGNPYADAVAQAEVLDERAVVDSLTRLLYDGGYRADRIAAQDRYADQVLALPPTGEVFTAMAARLGIGVG